jgi:aryl-alcohol dehydrogenase-like predicted oxidoreductase
MRYRPFGSSGSAVSVLTLGLGRQALSRGSGAAEDLIFAALEQGINSYVLQTSDPVLAEVVGHALANVDRKLLNVTLTLGTGDGRRGSERDFSAEGMTGAIDRALHISGLGWFDTAILDQPAEEELAQSSLQALKALRATERVKLLGVSGGDVVMDAYVSTGAFDVLMTPFHVYSDWRVQSRVRAAREQDMAIMTYNYFPRELHTPKDTASLHASKQKKGFFGFGSGGRGKNDPLAGAGTFAFLHQTPNWTAQAICLGHAMTNPSIASVVVHANNPEELAMLATVPERDMPPGLSAQIEMARISTSANREAA